MADRRRIVTLNEGNRPVVELDLETGQNFQAIKDTFAYQPGQANAVLSREPSRFGGAQTVGEQADNGIVIWQALVRGDTPDQVAANIETLLQAANRTVFGRKLEWRPDGNTYSSFFRIAGPFMWKPTYSWMQWQGARSMVVDVQVPVRPLVDWDPMTIVDAFDIDTLAADYTADTSPGSTAWVTGGIGATGNLTAERRYRHTCRGYKLLEAQADLAAWPGSTISGFKAGVLLRADASSYVEVYVDDNGTNSRLRVDVVIAGVRTNRASVNLAARVVNGVRFWVRGRVENQTVYAEYFTSRPDPMSAPVTSTTPYTLTVGEQGSLSAGHTGWSWVPQHAASVVGDFASRPFTWRNRALPQVLVPLDAIPGTASADVAATVTSSGGTSAPAWPLVAWSPINASYPGDVAVPFGIVDFADLSDEGLTETITATARSGTDHRMTASGSVSFQASVFFQPGDVIGADEFTDGRLDIEVWARLVLSNGLVNPRVTLSTSLYSSTVGRIGTQYSEFGAGGRVLTKPASGTVHRFVRAGVVSIDPDVGQVVDLTVTADGVSSGAAGIDYVVIVPARRRACGMTGVAASSVSPFAPSTGQWTTRVASDLSATLSEAGSLWGFAQAHGLGGSLIYPPPGKNVWLFKLSSLVPDDPTSNTATEQVEHNATVSLDVTPRSYMMRGG